MTVPAPVDPTPVGSTPDPTPVPDPTPDLASTIIGAVLSELAPGTSIQKRIEEKILEHFDVTPKNPVPPVTPEPPPLKGAWLAEGINQAVCTCGWKSSTFLTAEEAFAAGMAHLASNTCSGVVSPKRVTFG